MLTHDTSTHTGGGGDKPEVNLGLVESKTAWDIGDHSAWHVNFADNPSLFDVWDTFGSYIKLLNFGLLFWFFPLFFYFLVGFLCAISLLLWEQGVNSVAPLCWLLVLSLTIWLGLLPFPADPPKPRWQRRHQALSVQHARCGRDPGSIRSHGLHRSYPLSLHSSGTFVQTPPPLHHPHAWKDLDRIMGKLQHYLHRLGLSCASNPKKPPGAGKGQKGETHKGCKKDCNSRVVDLSLPPVIKLKTDASQVVIQRAVVTPPTNLSWQTVHTPRVAATKQPGHSTIMPTSTLLPQQKTGADTRTGVTPLSCNSRHCASKPSCKRLPSSATQ
jgi:hypothetical protein